VAERFPQADVSFRLKALPPTVQSPAPNAASASMSADNSAGPEAQTAQVVANMESPVPLGALAPAPAPGATSSPPSRAVIRPTAPERYALQVTISGNARDKLRRAQELLGFQVNANDVAQVLELALEALVEKLERKKCARTERPRRVPPPRSQDPYYV